MSDVLKRILKIVIILLFIISIGRDLTTGTFPAANISTANEHIEKAEEGKQLEPIQKNSFRYKRLQHKVTAGETVLSIIEKLNQNGPPVTIQQMLLDFSALNPDVDPHHIKTNNVYFFPVYQQNENRL